MHAPFRGATHVDLRDSALALFDRSCHVTEVPTNRPGRIMLMAMPEKLYHNATYNAAVPL